MNEQQFKENKTLQLCTHTYMIHVPTFFLRMLLLLLFLTGSGVTVGVPCCDTGGPVF